MASKTDSTPTAPAEAGDRGRSSLAHGYASLEDVRLNDTTVYRILQSGGTLEQCVIALANEKNQIAEKALTLSLIAPKKMRFPDGSVRIYRAPEHLIPDPA